MQTDQTDEHAHDHEYDYELRAPTTRIFRLCHRESECMEPVIVLVLVRVVARVRAFPSVVPLAIRATKHRIDPRFIGTQLDEAIANQHIFDRSQGNLSTIIRLIA